MWPQFPPLEWHEDWHGNPSTTSTQFIPCKSAIASSANTYSHKKGLFHYTQAKQTVHFVLFFTDKRYWWPFEQLGKKSSNSDGQSSFIRNVKDFRRLIATWAQDSSAVSLYQKELPEEKLSHGWVFGGRRGRVRWKPQHHGASSCSYWC